MSAERSPRTPEEIRVRGIRFLGEQDGPPERLLKGKLADMFREDENVNRAYLARVSSGPGGTFSVILGLRTLSKSDQEAIIQKVGKLFAFIFGAKEHLDIMFLTEAQEAQLSKVCQPFFG